MTGVCIEPIADTSGAFITCGLPKVQGSNRYCIWHRLMRTAMQSQVAEADERLANHQGPLVRVVREKDWPAGCRWCSGCQSFIPVFYCTSTRGVPLTMCRACHHRSRSRSRTLTVYGVGHERRSAVLALQDGRCAGCRNRQVRQELATDHDHKTGAFRGLLCDQCNHKVLGGAHDSVLILLRCAYYLMNPPAAENTTWQPPEDLDLVLSWKPLPPLPA